MVYLKDLTFLFRLIDIKFELQPCILFLSNNFFIHDSPLPEPRILNFTRRLKNTQSAQVKLFILGVLDILVILKELYYLLFLRSYLSKFQLQQQQQKSCLSKPLVNRKINAPGP